MDTNYDNIRGLSIGSVEFVSPKEIKILLEIDAPQSTSLNAGIPQLFPKVNGFLLIPNEAGALIGMITWIGIEYSAYPKRKGFKDFDLVDLPFPLRKISLSPIGVLKDTPEGYKIERGVYSYPSVGDRVVIPTQEQLKTVVQNKSANAKVCIGTSPIAANAPIYVDPDKVFGRHIAVLGNTGSGKSCSVAGLIRWSIETAKGETKKEGYKQKSDGKVNARFIVLDPNGEYGEAFKDITDVKRYEVKLRNEGNIRQLKVPSWMWNSWEWASVSQASARTQRPILRRALREIKNAEQRGQSNKNFHFKNFLTSLKISLLYYQKSGAKLSESRGKQNYGEFLENIKKSLETFTELQDNEENIKKELLEKCKDIIESHKKDNRGYFPAFSLQEVNPLLDILSNAEQSIGYLTPYEGPDEDSPVFFKNEEFLAHIEQLSQEANQQQYLDFFIMRVRSLFTDQRISSVIKTEQENEVTLEQWLKDYIGSDDSKPSISVIDLSLLPSEIIYLVVAVMARIIFEAHQRYKKKNDNILPTTLIVEEAHNFIKHYEIDDENISSQRLCTQIFEKIAREGRKFGLGLVISSQRPSELSKTVLSQCNTFLIHRIVSDRDQEMVKKLVPDTMGGILNELSVLPTRKAILLGWAAPIPVLVEMRELKEEHRPKSKDPEYWDVWIGHEKRNIDWKKITNDWQNKD